MEEKLPSFLSSPSPTPSKIPTPLTPAIFSLIWLSVQRQSNPSPPSLPSNHLRGKSCCNYILSKRAVVHLTFHNSVTGPLNGVSNLFLQPPGCHFFSGFSQRMSKPTLAYATCHRYSLLLWPAVVYCFPSLSSRRRASFYQDQFRCYRAP